MDITEIINSSIIPYVCNTPLTQNQKIALAILIHSKYEGCCGCDGCDLDYMRMENLVDIIDDEICFNYGNCYNGFCIHIRKISSVIKHILPSYPFEFDIKNDINEQLRNDMMHTMNNIDEQSVIENILENLPTYGRTADAFVHNSSIQIYDELAEENNIELSPELIERIIYIYRNL